MHAIVGLLTKIMVGQVDRASNRITHQIWWRIPINLIIFGSALWIAFSSAFLWRFEGYPGITGLLDHVRHGGPIWLLSVPLVAVMIVFAGGLPVTGRYGLVLVLQCATFALVLLGLAAMQKPGQLGTNFAAISCFLVSFPALALALVTALADNPPIDSPLARFTFSYFGRFGHLRALHALARRYGWEVETPRPPLYALNASGYYGNGRSVRVSSGVTYVSKGPTDPMGYWYTVTVTTMRPIAGFNIGREKVPPEFAPYAITGKITRFVNYYVMPPRGMRVPDSWSRRFAEHLTSGKRYLRTVYKRVEPVAGGIFYREFNPLLLTTKSGQIEPLVDWLSGILTLLEEIAPETDVTASSPDTDTLFAMRLPHRQPEYGDPDRQPR